jgi:phage recombination protein Bet
MSNQLIPKDYEVSYKVNEEKIVLDLAIVRNTIAKGDNISDTEIYTFMQMCMYQKLNPFLGEAHLIKYGDKIQNVVGIDVFTTRLNEHPQCKGWQAGLILVNEDGEEKERKGAFYRKGKEKIIGAWFKCHKEGWNEPFEWAIEYGEYEKTYYDKKSGSYKIMPNWRNMPATMLSKCVIAAGARKAFSKDFSGMYAMEEVGADLDKTKIIDLTDDYEKEKNIKSEEKEKQSKEKSETKDSIITKEDREKIYDAVSSDVMKIDSQKTYEFIKYTINQLIKNKKLPAKTTINNLKKDKINLVINQIKGVIKAAESKHIKKEGEKIIDDKENSKMQEMKYEEKAGEKDDKKQETKK